MTTTEPHPALRHRNPICYFDPGQGCRTHHEVDCPHSRRIFLASPGLRPACSSSGGVTRCVTLTKCVPTDHMDRRQ